MREKRNILTDVRERERRRLIESDVERDVSNSRASTPSTSFSTSFTYEQYIYKHSKIIFLQEKLNILTDGQEREREID